MTDYQQSHVAQVLGLIGGESIPPELYDAARVSRFIQPERLGRWQLTRFTRTMAEYERTMRNLYFTSDHPDHELARCVPPGDYVSLQRRMTEQEMHETFENELGHSVERMEAEMRTHRPDLVPNALDHFLPDESRWIPVMSDTPSEIAEHYEPLNGARGRVLITGLGLGCLPHALLTLPDVKRIDIIEIDPQVIALTGKYLTDPRVRIWRGNAAEPHRIPGFRAESWAWDYAWHDIWSHISARNLHEDEAEHGIAYDTLFEVYSPYADEQSAWAIHQAHDMQRHHEEALEAELEFRRKVRTAPTLEAQVDLVYGKILASRVRVGTNADPFPDGIVPEEIRRALDPEGSLREHIRTVMSDPNDEIWTRINGDPVDEPEPLGRPNAHLEET